MDRGLGDSTESPRTLRAGQHEAETGEQHAEKLSRLQRLRLCPEKAETLDEHGRDYDHEKIEHNVWVGPSLGATKARPVTMNAPIIPPATVFHP